MISHGQTYIYSGEGAWPVSVDQTQEMLEAVIDPRGIKRVYSFLDIDKNTQLIVVPGGSSPYISCHINSTSQKISEYVKGGGRYLGICAGGIIVTDHITTKPRIVDIYENSAITALQKTGNIYMQEYRQLNDSSLFSNPLYSGTCVIPHIVKFAEDADHIKNVCAVDVTSTEEGLTTPFKAFHYSGPAFIDTPLDSKVLLKYKDPLALQKVKRIFDPTRKKHIYQLTGEKRVDQEPVAALSCTYGDGKVVLSGVHPEINPETFPESAFKHNFPGELPKELASGELGRKAFISRIFKELHLDTPT